MIEKGYPVGSFKFKVEINDIELYGGFSEVSGIEAEIELEEYREGGTNYTHHFPKFIKHPRLTLKKGIVESGELLNWYKSVLSGKILKQKISVVLCNSLGKDISRWDFMDAYPVKWSGPELKADSNMVAVESIEFVHKGMK